MFKDTLKDRRPLVGGDARGNLFWPWSALRLKNTRVTVLNKAKNMAGGIAFANYLLSSQGQSLLQAQGVLTTPFTAGGDKTAIPQQLQ